VRCVSCGRKLPPSRRPFPNPCPRCLRAAGKLPPLGAPDPPGIRTPRAGPLAVLTPFEGKSWALDRWLGALRVAALPAQTQLLWLCNSDDDAFYQRLEAASHTMPWPVTLWQDPHKETGGPVKDWTVAYLWRELRKRTPSETQRVLTLEDDVLLMPGTVAALFALPAEHGSNSTVVAAPVPSRIGGQSRDGVWVYGKGYGDHTVAPRTGATDRVDWCTFGCTLFPRGLFDRIPLIADLNPGPYCSYDHYACEYVRGRGGQIIAVWEARVGHMVHPQ